MYFSLPFIKFWTHFPFNDRQSWNGPLSVSDKSDPIRDFHIKYHLLISRDSGMKNTVTATETAPTILSQYLCNQCGNTAYYAAWATIHSIGKYLCLYQHGYILLFITVKRKKNKIFLKLKIFVMNWHDFSINFETFSISSNNRYFTIWKYQPSGGEQKRIPGLWA